MRVQNLLVLGIALTALSACKDATAPATKSENSAQMETIKFETYSAEDFFETTSYGMASSSGYAFSPDDKAILVSSDETGIFNGYAMPIDGSAPETLTTSTVDSTFATSWFPDDRRILLSRDSGGNELNHVYVRELDGTVTDLTPGDNLKAFFNGWHQSGDSFYVSTNERDPKFFDLYEYETEGYARKLTYQNDTGFEISSLSGNGQYLALVRSRTSADSDIFLKDLNQAGEPELITQHEGNIAYGAYTFTPDNQSLIYATNEFGEFNQAWSYNLASGERSKLIADNWDVSYVAYSPSGNFKVWAINEDARTKVRVEDTRTGKPLSVDFPNGSLGNIRFSRDEGKLAFMLSKDTSPNNAMVVDLTSGEITSLTNALNPAIQEANLVEATIQRYKSFDGLDIPGVLYRPKNATAENPVPALVWVHGGPGGQSRAGYSATLQHLVNHGYVVFAANNRGSSGYGKTFFHMDDKKHGDVDLKDIVYAKKWLQTQEWVDEDRIGIIGGSYGGYMVGAALAFEPEEFDVGVNIFGVMNWVRTLESIPPWWESFREALYDEMGDPATDAERHRAISPLFHAEKIQAPFLVVQGANDPRVLQVESDEIVAAVRANGVPVEYVLFDDEGHGFSKKENRIEASEAYLKFLDTYLKNAGGPD